MQILQYIFPFIFLVFVISGFFVDISLPKGKIILGIVVLLSFPLAGMSVYLAKENQSEIIASKAESASISTWKQSIIARLASLLSSKRTEVLTEREKLGDYTKLGWTSKHPLFQEAQLADAQRSKLMSVIDPPNNAVNIENLPDSVDKMIVSWSLEELGYRVSSEQNQAFLIDDAENQADDEDEISDEDEDKPSKETVQDSNTLYYGSMVRNHDIKLIAYTMIRAGVQLKMIRPFKNKKAENSRSIRFEWSKSYSKRETISVEKLMKKKRFKR